jgi:WD40 repeat protein
MAPKIAQWVDLVFGYAQTGVEAEKHLNLFIPYIYSDVWDKFKETATKQQNMIFELTMNLGSIPQQIFTEPVIYSPTSQTSDLEMSSTLHVREHPAVSADFFFNEEQKQSVFIMANNGSIVQYTANFLAGTLTKVAGKSITAPSDSNIICSNSSGIAISRLTGNAIVISGDKSSKAEIGERNLKIICQDEDSILTASANGIVTIQSDKSLDTPTTKISAFSDTITAISFSNFFGVVVVATADGRLSLYSKRTGLLIKQQEFSDITKAVLVTKGYGYILASTAHNIYILTNNGSIARVVPVERDISNWCTWTDQNGVDFVCSSDANGNILVFEAFYPEKILFSATCGARILSIKYDKRLMGVVTITTVPDIHFYPFA